MFDFVRYIAMRFGFYRLCRDNKAVTALEYGLIASLVAVVIIGAVTLLGTNIGKTFNSVSTAI